MVEEQALIINPIVHESIQHNARTISNIRSLTASLFGICAGILGLESWPGFLFYLIGTLFVSGLASVILAQRQPENYFHGGALELVGKDVFGGLSSFVLTWTLFFGLVRA